MRILPLTYREIRAISEWKKLENRVSICESLEGLPSQVTRFQSSIPHSTEADLNSKVFREKGESHFGNSNNFASSNSSNRHSACALLRDIFCNFIFIDGFFKFATGSLFVEFPLRYLNLLFVCRLRYHGLNTASKNVLIFGIAFTQILLWKSML